MIDWVLIVAQAGGIQPERWRQDTVRIAGGPRLQTRDDVLVASHYIPRLKSWAT